MKTFLKDLLTPVAVLILTGVVLFDRVAPQYVPDPAPAPVLAVDGVVLGKAYAPVLLATYADAWLAAAKTLEDGKPVAEAQKTLQESWKDARIKAFTENLAASFALVLPEGTEPSSPEKRAQVVEFWRAFARGLKAGR